MARNITGLLRKEQAEESTFDKAKLREQIERDTKKYLASGGLIDYVDSSVSGIDIYKLLGITKKSVRNGSSTSARISKLKSEKRGFRENGIDY